MKYLTKHTGSIHLVAIFLVVGIIVITSMWLVSRNEVDRVPSLIPSNEPAGSNTVRMHTSIAPSVSSGTNTYSGTRLAGNTAPLLQFTVADYEVAKASGKLIVLYYYANWCPICKEEFPKVEAAFNELSTDRVIGFRVNFNDTETDDAEKALAREHGVAYQHTKVFVRNNERILKSPETWSTDRYLTEITNALAR